MRPSGPPKSRVKTSTRARGQQRAAPSRTSRRRRARSVRGPRRRQQLLRSLVAQTDKLPWSSSLVTALIEELYVEEEFNALLGDPEVLPLRRYPQAIALALALRHSWRPDDLACILRRLRIRKKVTS